MLFDHNCSTVSMCSERHCGTECGQKILPINGNPAYGEYFCCVYVTLQNRKRQVIFSVPVVQILDSIKQGKCNTFFEFFQKMCCIFATLWYNKNTVKWCALAYHRAPRSYWRSFLVFFVLQNLFIAAHN